MTTGLNSLAVNSVSCAGSAKLNILDIGKLSKSLVSPNLLTLVAYPVLYVTVLGAGRSLCRYILCGSLKSGNGKALVVGYNGACCIKIEYVAVSTVPVLKTTGVVTTGLNSLVVNSVSCAGSANSNRHLVCLNGAFSIKPSITAIGAVPVLNITDLGTGRSLSLYVYDGMSCIGIGLLEALHTYLITRIEVGMFVRCLNGNSYISTIESNGYSAARFSNGVSLISGGICSTPIVVTNALKCVGTCRNIGVYLGVNTVGVCHIVCGVAGIPLGAEMCAGACNSPGSVCRANVTLIVGTVGVGVTKSRIALVYSVLLTIATKNLLVTVLGTSSSLLLGGYVLMLALTVIDNESTPCSATLIPCTFLNGIMVIAVGRNGKVTGLVPLLVITPTISTIGRIHSAENNVGICLVGRNINLINAKIAVISHTNPCVAISKEICSKTSIILFPICIRSKIKLLGSSRTSGDHCHCHCHEKSHNKNKSHD